MFLFHGFFYHTYSKISECRQIIGQICSQYMLDFTTAIQILTERKSHSDECSQNSYLGDKFNHSQFTIYDRNICSSTGECADYVR